MAQITKAKTHTIKRIYTELGANGVMMFHECMECGKRADESLDLIGEECNE